MILLHNYGHYLVFQNVDIRFVQISHVKMKFDRKKEYVRNIFHTNIMYPEASTGIQTSTLSKTVAEKRQ